MNQQMNGERKKMNGAIRRVNAIVRLAFVTIAFALPVAVSAQSMEKATDAVKAMRVGWNLGNTLDCHSSDTTNMWIEAWTQRRPSDYETAWGQAQTTQALMTMMHDAGFNAIRVPVTWYPHLKSSWKLSKNSQGNPAVWSPTADPLGTEIDKQWMARVKQVVDYVLSTGMYCILNVHHDTGADNTAWLRANGSTFAAENARYAAVWKQIAEEFKDYGDHLLFEGYNEMLDGYSSWCFASFAAPGQYNATSAADTYAAINDYAQTFVNTIRATGGNNAQRNLVVNTYGSCDGRGSWNSHLKDPLSNMKLPTDAADGHLIFEVHSYPDVSNPSNARNEVDAEFNSLDQLLASKGAPVIIGEWGSSDLQAYSKTKQNLLDFAKYFVGKAKEHGFATFYWMGISDGNDRAVPQFTQADLKDKIMEGYYGDGGYTSGITPPQVSPASASSASHAVYNLMGQRLTGTPSHGIYIINSRKVVIK